MSLAFLEIFELIFELFEAIELFTFIGELFTCVICGFFGLLADFISLIFDKTSDAVEAADDALEATADALESAPSAVGPVSFSFLMLMGFSFGSYELLFVGFSDRDGREKLFSTPEILKILAESESFEFIQTYLIQGIFCACL